MTTKLQLDAQDRTARVLCAYLRGDMTAVRNTLAEAFEDTRPGAPLELLNQLAGTAAGLAVDVAGGDEAQALRNLEAARAEVAYTTPEEHDPDTPTG